MMDVVSDDEVLVENEHLSLSETVKRDKMEQETLLRILSKRDIITKTSWSPEELVDFTLEGLLYKKETKSSSWQRYYFRLSPKTLELQYWKSKDDFKKQKPFRHIPISWMWYEHAEEDHLVHKQAKSSIFSRGKVEVCTYRVSVFSQRKTYILSAQNDEEMIKWLNKIQSLLNLLLPKESVVKKDSAAAKLGPLQHKQLVMEREQYKHIVQSLQTAGIFPDRPSGKKREGYLEMQKADGSWKKYYFVLFKESLSYFNLDDKLLPRGVILLDSISSIRSVMSKPGNSQPQLPSSSDDEAEPMDVEGQPVDYPMSPSQIPTSPGGTVLDDKEQKCPFSVHTPLRTYSLRAKHEEAMKDWIILIQQLRSGKIEETVQRSADDVAGQPIKGNKFIILKLPGGKEKKIKLKKNTIIGRSTKSDVYINDVKMSRNHARIEIVNDITILYDLGSLAGTIVNGKKVIKTALYPDDTIQLGSTTFTFAVESSSPTPPRKSWF